MSIGTRITAVFYRLASWAVIKCASRHPDPRAFLVDATYKELERKAQRVHEVKEMISELDDLMAEAAEALVAANEDYIATLKVARETLGIEVYE